MSAKNFYINEHAVVDDGVEIGEGTKIWHFSHVQSGSKLGKKCVLGQNVNVGNNVNIGNFVKIQNNVSVYEGVTLEDYVFCGPSMVFTNILDPKCMYPQVGAEFYINTLVKTGASIGANATIVCGNTIMLKLERYFQKYYICITKERKYHEQREKEVFSRV